MTPAQRVARRAELRRLAAERANATISRVWMEHYHAQFVESDREAKCIAAAWRGECNS